MQKGNGDIWLELSASSGAAVEASDVLFCQKIEINPKGENPADLLFDAAPAGGDVRVIAILDAARVFGLPEILHASGLRHVSLFQEGTDDNAPFLVELSADSRLTRRLLDGRDRPTNLLHANAGIHFRTALDMASLRRHLRRLMRVTDEAGQVCFFRFWEPWAAQCYFRRIADMPQRVLHWFRTVEGQALGEVLVPDPQAGWIMVFGAPGLGDAPRPHVPFRLGPAEHWALQQARLRSDLDRIVELIGQTFPEIAERLGRVGLERQVTRSISRMQELGIRQRNNLMRTAVWDLHSDGRVEARDGQGQLRQILEGPMPEAQKMLALTARIAELDQTASPGRLG